MGINIRMYITYIRNKKQNGWCEKMEKEEAIKQIANKIEAELIYQIERNSEEAIQALSDAIARLYANGMRQYYADSVALGLLFRVCRDEHYVYHDMRDEFDAILTAYYNQ